MKFYSVQEVASMLHTNPETIRRWIRADKLAASIVSDKGGHMISEEALRAFAKTSPKYASILASTAMASPMALSIVLGSLLGGLMLVVSETKSKKVTVDDVKKTIDKRIAEQEKAIAAKEKQLKRLKAEIIEDRKNLEKYKAALEELDLEVVAAEVNKGTEEK